MPKLRTYLSIFLLLVTAVTNAANAQNINLEPKYGGAQKNEAQQAADAKFLTNIDDFYKGNRKKAAEDLAGRGWQMLRQGNMPDAIRRFNQAWLIDNNNGNALWGMAAVQGSTGKLESSLALFAEAEPLIGDDVDFAVDYAKTIGMAGAETKNETLLKDAFNRFEKLHQKAPQHTVNLQNWAITLFYVENYAEAWKKIKLAEATPRRAEINPNFIADLQSKMPRPQ